MSRKVKELDKDNINNCDILSQIIVNSKITTDCIVKCHCGKIFKAKSFDLLSGHTGSCGCLKLRNLKTGSSKDEWSLFRWYYHKAKTRYYKKRKKKEEFNISLEYLAEIWKSQNGICPLTGWKLKLRDSAGSEKLTIYHASLDRIDNSKGYIKENVRFISIIANLARSRWTDKEVIEFCNAVSQNHASMVFNG